MVKTFEEDSLKKLFRPDKNSSGEDNGQVTIIGGSSLFHGAPLLSLKVASRIVDMVFFATPEKSVGVVAESLKSKLLSFVWVPWEEVDNYIPKSEAVLIGPGFMRFRSEKVPHGERHHVCDKACQTTTQITRQLLKKFPDTKWVIDAGSLQVMDVFWIPKGAVLTPNKKEYNLLFGDMRPQEAAKKYNCTIVLKGPTTLVCSPDKCVEVRGGNAGMTKGGTGDVQSGLTVALLAKNEPFLAACAGAYVTKAAGDALYKEVGTNYNADDLADRIPTLFFPQKMR